MGSPLATQDGLATALAVTQGAISKILTRLAVAGLVSSRLVHVAGRGRRVRVYELTAIGESTAQAARGLGAARTAGEVSSIDSVVSAPGQTHA